MSYKKFLEGKLECDGGPGEGFCRVVFSVDQVN